MTPYPSRIKDWPESERPRERLLREGATPLSEAQLIAILLRTGTRRKTAQALAMELLDRFGGLRGLDGQSIEALCTINGMGLAKACQLKAALELAKKLTQQTWARDQRINSSEEVYQYLRLRLRDLPREEFFVLYLTTRHDILDCTSLFKGTLTESLVSPRDIVHGALQRGAAAMILAHNHPSGDPQPSEEDRQVTRKIGGACAYFDLRLIDHLIVGRDGYFSFADAGLPLK
jgi:DNA repair protein RadC